MTIQGVRSIHLASQYLAATGISFLQKKEDDSHTNFGFNGKAYLSRPLNQHGDILALNLEDFALEWRSGDQGIAFPLDNASHADVLKWIRRMAANSIIDSEYHYDLPYSLPYSISDQYKFQKDETSLRAEIHSRTLAQNILEQILDEFGLESEIRTWPHHFDTGAYASLPDRSDISIGLGLAIPDSLISDYYFYIAAYTSNGPLSTNSFKPLNSGQWLDNGFKGAVVPVTNLPEETVKIFFREAISSIRASG